MTDETAGNGQSGKEPAGDGQPANEQPSGSRAVPPPETASRPPFPAVRLLYAIGFAVVAWFVFWITLILALVQFVVVAINGKVNEELKSFTINLIQYLWELLAFVTFVRDEQPFPIGPFPKNG
ncbi:MAG: DUF4389 domain-containing protein [Alphaproteobacteria bacterium]|nr:DUF4389 domain-containing protein [Alphaproteobacteria bacterium]MBU6471822.1 DUF4389 domain-containing protein [Alphaproteobacteria bacterium]MDE2011684.1 DUF4389 domain-containing protein [Alphaproteobacteria bacterium]MDE2072554.1 DUF4389 domain-containing protein [Alphaproteobacteria bacterium]